MTKSEIRSNIKAQKRALTAQEIAVRSHAICRNFLQQPFYQQAEVIYAYAAYNQEIRTEEIMEDAWRQGKRVAVPKVIGEGMAFFYINALSQLEDGYCHIPEPVTTEEADDACALILMPGLAFDTQFHRIGYGGGYYDRYLDEKRDCDFLKVALAYDFQLLDRIETEAHDYKIDALVLADRCLIDRQ